MNGMNYFFYRPDIYGMINDPKVKTITSVNKKKELSITTALCRFFKLVVYMLTNSKYFLKTNEKPMYIIYCGSATCGFDFIITSTVFGFAKNSLAKAFKSAAVISFKVFL